MILDEMIKEKEGQTTAPDKVGDNPNCESQDLSLHTLSSAVWASS